MQAEIRRIPRRGLVLFAACLAGSAVFAAPAQATSPETVARSQQKPVEMRSERTENSSTFANPDGSRTTQVHGGPVHVRRGGDWVPVDLTLEKSADGLVRPKAHPRELVLAGASAKSGDLATVQSRDGKVALQYPGALPEPVLTGETATYPEIQPGVDLQVKATRTGFEQFFVVKRRPDRALTFALPLRATGLTPRTDADGNTQLVTASGAVVGSVPAAEMWDSRIDQRSGDPVAKVKVGKVVSAKERGTLGLNVTPDAGYFADPARSYPVIVDPGVSVWTNFDTFTQSNIATTDQSGATELRIGTYDGGATKARSYLHFDVARFRGAAIESATLSLWGNHSYSCSPRNWEIWDSLPADTGTRWANQPPPRTRWATTNATRGYSAACAADWVRTPIGNLVGAWAGSGVTTGSMVLKAENESDSFGWKKFSSGEGGKSPYIEVTYRNQRPNPAAGHDISDRVDIGGVTHTKSLTPTLRFTPTDPDGGNVTAVFYVYEGETMIGDFWKWDVPSGTTATWTVPPGLLQENHSYRFRATTFDPGEEFADDAWVSLQAVSSGLYADVAACGWNNGTKVQQWPSNGADCQKFFPWGTGDGYYQFRAKHSGQVLDNTGCHTASGNPVTTYDRVAGACQKWTIEPQTVGTGVYRYAVQNAGKLLDQGCTAGQGAPLFIWDRIPGRGCQNWRMPVSPANGATVQWLPFTVNTAAE
ncbi:RICIN domain-containing protein [Amycolatopsis sp. WAC 01375]|uniref:RICIN domain-containing protein n=1 Tax=Amycolatopsis sp. WAC 01375 TaxID=2203194 RepID=UPI000F79B05B|nr:RICIN domain-containing protein [Amycolatopsis sp. WAC 01375]